MIWGSRGLAKAAGAEPAGQMRDEKLHAVVARSTFPSQNVQNTPFSGHFWKLRCRKSARRCGAKHILKSTCTKHTSSGPLLEVQMSKKCTPLWREAHFQVKNVKNTRGSDHFWKFRCRKSARRCGAKHILKSTCTKHTSSGPLLEVQMSKKCTPLWREAHFEVNMYKTHQLRTTFGSSDVEKVHAVVARSTFPSQNVKNTRGSDHFWKFRCRKSARRCGAKHISKSKCLKHQGFGPLLEVQMPLRFASLQYTTLHYTTLHSTTLHYTALHNTTTITTQLHSTTLHYTKITLHYTTLHYTTLHCTTFHYTSLHYTTLHYTITTTTTTQLHSTTLKYTTLQYITLHYSTTLHYTTPHSTTLQLQLHNYTPLHSTTLNYTTLHYITLHSTTLHYFTLPSTTLHYIT